VTARDTITSSCSESNECSAGTGQRSAAVRHFGIAGQEAIMDELANPRMITGGDNRWL